MPERELRTYSYVGNPTLQRFAMDDSFLRGVMGPFNGGKSSACVIEMVNRARRQRPGPDGVRRTRCAVIRNTLPELKDTTIKTVMEWLPELQYGVFRQSDMSYRVTGIPECELEIVFRGLDRPDHVKKLLSAEYTFAWVNEAREVPWAIIEALQGRVDRYPSKDRGGATWSGVWMDTNPPDEDSRWFDYFERVVPNLPNPFDRRGQRIARLFKQPGGLAANAENIHHINGGRNYYERLAVGKTPEWIKVYIDGEYGFVVDGKPVYPEYIDSFHCAKIDPIPGLPIYRGWDFGLCYSDDTEVLTDSGWKLFKDVDEKVDRAASRDPISGEMYYAPIAFKVAMPFKGEMLQWKSTELDMLVTPEHIVPFTYRDNPGRVHWRSAEWLAAHSGGHHYVDLTSIWAGDERMYREYGGRRWSSGVLAAFLGLYLSEGSAHGGRITIYQAVQRPEMETVLRATGLTWRWCDGKAAGWSCWSPELARTLKKLGRAWEKRVPAVIGEMDPERIRIFLMAYTAGDGHIRRRANGSEEHTLFSTSKGMADDIQELAQKAGWNSSVRRTPPGTSYLDGRRIDSRPGYVVTFKKRASRAELLPRNFQRVPYDGTVYCLNVPDHTLYVRRNGRAHWNGNTPTCILCQDGPDGFVIFDELGGDWSGIDQFSDVVLEHCDKTFPPDVEFIDYGDPAGEQSAQTDERTCFDILHSKGIEIEGGAQDLETRIGSVRLLLNRVSRGLRLHPRCRKVRKGFMGGYNYRRRHIPGLPMDERYQDKPDKNWASHFHDAIQYVTSRLYGGSLRIPRRARERMEQGDESGGYDSDFGYTGLTVGSGARSRYTGY